MTNRSLEEEHAKVYSDLTHTLDELMYHTKLKQLKESYLRTRDRNAIEEEYNKVIKTIDLDLGKEKDSSELMSERIELLKKLLTIRNNIIKQQFITYPILRSLHGNTGLVDKEKKLIEIARKKDDLSMEYNEYLTKFKKITDDELVYDIKRKKLDAFVAFQDQLTQLVEIYNEIKDLKFKKYLKEDEFNTDVDNEKDINKVRLLKIRNNNLIKKNFLLNDFINNLIYSLNINWANDEYLNSVILEINDFNDYEFEDI